MPQITYRANLSAANFPLSLAQAGRSVIIPGPDSNYDRRVDPAGEGSDAGIPQAIYLENVIPTASGYQSVGLEELDSIPMTTAAGTFEIDAVYATNQNIRVTVAYKASTMYCSNLQGVGNWTAVVFSGTSEFPTGGISSAIVRGTCYVLIKGASNSELYTAAHDGVTLTLTNVTATVTPGGFVTDAKRICAAYNYLICLKDDGIIYWSSTTTPTDFVASLVTGAGSQTPSGVTVISRNIFSCNSGFYIETFGGLIYAQYTGNSRYPWKMVPVESTGLIVSYSFGDSNSANTFAITSSGAVLNIVQNKVEDIASELSAHLRRVPNVDKFNSGTNTFSTENVIIGTEPRVYLFFDRYICLSCESTVANKYNSIIVYDISLRRYGKIKVPHTFLAHYNSFLTEINSERIGIIDDITGKCYIVDFDTNSTVAAHSGVLVLGKFQYVRSRFLALDEIAIEGELPSVTVRVLPSLDGKNFDTAIIPALVDNTATLKSYTCRTEAKNQTVVIKGAFSVDTLELVFHPGAGR